MLFFLKKYILNWYEDGSMSEKKKKVLGRIIITCFIIILLELVLMAIMKIGRERDIDRIKSLNDLVMVDDGYIGVGVSDFHQSKFVDEKTYQYTESISKEKQKIIATQSRIVKFDKDMHVVWENTYKGDYDSTFYSVIEVEDGYIAVGSFISDYKQIEANTRNAMIVKYDKNGKKVWDNTYKVLSDTEFYKVIEDDEDYIVIGQSIYENMEMGTHTIGGGIIVRYSSDGEELAHNNYGGNKSGIFTDIIKVDDGYIVCGKDASNYGIVLKFKKDFNREENDTSLISEKIVWERTYSNTDIFGFTSMALVDDNLYCVGAINVSDEKDKEGNIIFKYDAGYVVYSTNGKYIKKYSIGEDIHHRFNSLVRVGKYLYLSKLINVDSYYDGGIRQSEIVKYDLETEKIVSRYPFNDKNNYIINKIVDINNKHMFIGTTNNNCGLLGCDYEDVYEYIEDLKE